MNPTAHQLEELDNATSGNIGILTGGAGTGKSFTTAYYLKNLAGKYVVATPTGKAAARLREEGLPAATIHSTLGCQYENTSGGWYFLHNEHMPLQTDTLVVDEAFMIGTELMADLLRAVAPGTRILFTGDPNQLPPVGHGRPVLDMIDSGRIPHGHLSEVHRYAGRIAQVAGDINAGRVWTPSKAVDLDLDSPENFAHLESLSPDQTCNSFGTIIQKITERGFHPIRDIQVVCAMNDKGLLARSNLNRGLQGLLNSRPNSETFTRGKIKYGVGDKVICLRNHTRKVVDHAFLDEAYLANGEVGYVEAILWEKSKAIGVRVKFLDKKFELTGESFKYFDLAFAVTCHKMQGSQSPVVLIVADDSAKRVASRAWWYTAVTRASKWTLTIGRKNTILNQCERVDLQARKTFVAEGVKERFPRHNDFADDDLFHDL